MGAAGDTRVAGHPGDSNIHGNHTNKETMKALYNIFTQAYEAGLSANDLHALCSLEQAKRRYKENFEVLFAYGDLQEAGWLTDDFKYTDKAKAFLDELAVLFKPASKKVKIVIPPDMVTTYVELFPAIKFPSGKYARGNDKELVTAFTWFFTNYDYTWDEVLESTRRYLIAGEDRKWMYVKTSKYLIRKQASDKSWDSELAELCQALRDGVDEVVGDIKFKEKVV